MLKQKYRQIAPTLDYIYDEVILAQAWKKTQLYIRRHNWYADVLEIDCSAIDLENRIKKWADDLISGEYKPSEMRLVLAPKNAEWEFSTRKTHGSEPEFDSWQLKSESTVENDNKPVQKLRPLAHLSIRDQTVATAAMLCLADIIETAQGDPDEDYIQCQKNHMFSYGNRLYCEWISNNGGNKNAKFGWGNSKIYRDFYVDYKKFLARPQNMCQYYEPILAEGAKLVTVSLDLKGFYDCVDRRLLISKMMKLCKSHEEIYHVELDYHVNEDFESILNKIFSWEWSEDDLIHSDIVSQTNELPNGLPQGLVASGFFSNAYLIEFDKCMGQLLHKTEVFHEIIIRDYCRYVDDIRLVIEVLVDDKKLGFRPSLEMKINELLSECTDEFLRINPDKTTYTEYGKSSSQNNISALMTMFQSVISGTPDLDALKQVTGGLDNLLQIADRLNRDTTSEIYDMTLAEMVDSNTDVRDDTIKRFVASRIVKSLRLRKGMIEGLSLNEITNQSIDENDPESRLDHEFIVTARKLISSWSKNPSLNLLLRCGLDLYPDATMLTPVLRALESKIFHNLLSPTPEQIREIKSAEYAAADLLRASATQIGFKEDSEYPKSTDIQGYRQELADFAVKIQENKSIPWYVKQQAALFMAYVADYRATLSKLPELKHYNRLHRCMLYKKNNSVKVNELDLIAVSLVAQQIAPNKKKYASWFIDFVNQLSEHGQIQAVSVLFMNRPDLMEEVIKHKRISGAGWYFRLPAVLLKKRSKQATLLNPGIKIPLLDIVQGEDNPFSQENALLLLVRKILEVPGIKDKLIRGLSIEHIQVSHNNWNEIQSASTAGFNVHIEDGDYPAIDIPRWVDNKNEWMYNCGRILRSSITGEYDFTANSFLIKDEHSKYKGLRSTPFTRSFGLNNFPRGLFIEPSPLTPWLSELIMHLLQWPGVLFEEKHVEGMSEVKGIPDLQIIINRRIKSQHKMYGKQSGIPIYTIPVNSHVDRERDSLRVAIVQPLLPKMSDFDEKNPTYWSTNYRKRHRNHISSLCRLAYTHLSAWKTAREHEDFRDNQVDLIIFPELSVQPSDIDRLERLSDMTKANIFAGLTFMSRNNGNDTVNQALWLLRNEKKSGREFVHIWQGKEHLTDFEKNTMKIMSHRPYQVIIELPRKDDNVIRIAGTICYDATDLALASDLVNISDVFVVAAMNKDVTTFDSMVSALHYHMYQPVILANSGEFGGSTAQAPYQERYDKLIAHVHGINQLAISVFDVDALAFKKGKIDKKTKGIKTPPAGFNGRK